MDHVWTCQCCGKQFNTLPLDFACAAPDQWAQIPESERESRGKIDSDVCMIKSADQTDIFVRGCIEIPILGTDDKFVWGAWVSVSKDSFARILELWEAAQIEDEPPKFGWLSNAIKTYPSTLNLKTHLHLSGGGKRPSIELEPTDHPLAIEQRQGISIARVEEIATALLPRH
jgi:hypothetical protein